LLYQSAKSRIAGSQQPTGLAVCIRRGTHVYAPYLLELDRRTATYVDKILKGAKLVDLLVEGVKKFDLVINLRTAQQVGLTIPQSVLTRADKVIK